MGHRLRKEIHHPVDYGGHARGDREPGFPGLLEGDRVVVRPRPFREQAREMVGPPGIHPFPEESDHELPHPGLGLRRDAGQNECLIIDLLRRLQVWCLQERCRRVLPDPGRTFASQEGSGEKFVDRRLPGAPALECREPDPDEPDRFAVEERLEQPGCSLPDCYRIGGEPRKRP